MVRVDLCKLSDSGILPTHWGSGFLQDEKGEAAKPRAAAG